MAENQERENLKIETAYDIAMKNNYKFKDDKDKNYVINSCFLDTTENCRIDPLTNKPMEKCFYIRSNNKYGEMCRTLFSTLDVNTTNNLYTKNCEKKIGVKFTDCDCLNKDENVHYKPLAQTFSDYNHNCWFKPCSTNGYIMLKKPMSCPQDLKQKIEDFKFKNDGKTLLDFLEFNDPTKPVAEYIPLDFSKPKFIPKPLDPNKYNKDRSLFSKEKIIKFIEENNILILACLVSILFFIMR